MLRLMRALGACMLASALVPTVAAHAATYYVATTGSNSHPGTKEEEWRTVAYAVSKMVAGDTTYVKGGTYDEGLIRFGRTGTESAPIKLLNYPGQTPTIRCIDPKTQLMFAENYKGMNKPLGWITIEGFEITNCFYGFKYYNLHDSVIRRNWIHHNPMGAGIQGNGVRIVIDRNIINSNSKSRQNHGIYANGTSYTVTNNVFYDSYNYGIQLNAACWNYACYDPARHAGPEFARSDYWVIANNTFAYSYNRNAIVLYGSEMIGARIENNIFYENCVKCATSAANAIDFYASKPTGVTIRNNLAYSSGSGGQAFIVPGKAIEGVHYTQSDNIVNLSNPAFVNAPATLPSSPNFHLTRRSPAIDKGLSLEQSRATDTALPSTTTRIDFDGTPRPQGGAYDIGAYEYSAHGDTQAPRQVQDLQVH